MDVKELMLSYFRKKNNCVQDIFVNNLTVKSENQIDSTGDQALFVVALDKKHKYVKLEFKVSNDKEGNQIKLYYADKLKNDFSEEKSYVLSEMNGKDYSQIIKLEQGADSLRFDMGTMPATLKIEYFNIIPLQGTEEVRYVCMRKVRAAKKVIKAIIKNKALVGQFFKEVKHSGWNTALNKVKKSINGESKTVDNTVQIMEPYRVTIKKPLLPNRKKVLHIIENFHTGGSSRLIIDLIEYFGHKYEHKIFTASFNGDAEFLDVDVTVIDINNKAEVNKMIEAYDPEIIHVHIWESGWYEKVFNLLDAVKDRKIVQNINTPIKPILRDNIDKYVFVSNYVIREFHDPTDEKSMVIYPGSNFNMFTRELTPNYLAKDTIGMVYRLGYDKLSANSIDVFIKAVQKRPQTKAIIVGGGPRYEDYVQKVKDAGVMDNFEFTGYVPYEELTEWYKKFTIFVAPVWQESFGQVSPFAMNMGIPVAGYNVGALEEIIDNKSLLAPPEDSDKLSDVLVELLDDYERCVEIGTFNKQRASSHFAVETMVESYEKLYDKLVNEA